MLTVSVHMHIDNILYILWLRVYFYNCVQFEKVNTIYSNNFKYEIFYAQ